MSKTDNREITAEERAAQKHAEADEEYRDVRAWFQRTETGDVHLAECRWDFVRSMIGFLIGYARQAASLRQENAGLRRQLVRMALAESRRRSAAK